MKRERLFGVALGGSPAPTRAARGEEMLGTLLDAGGESNARFTRELGALIAAGLWARVTMTFRQLPRVYVPLALLTMFGPLLTMVVQSNPIHHLVLGVALIALLLWGLARRSHAVWWVLL